MIEQHALYLLTPPQPSPSLAERRPRAERIRAMSVGEKVRLAHLGTREDRSILVRDSNQRVAVSVIESGRLTAPEAVQYAQHRQTSDKVMGAIARSRVLMREYPVRVALVNNPKTPLEIVVRLIPLLQSRDLKALSRSREVPTVVSRVARQLHLKRSRAC